MLVSIPRFSRLLNTLEQLLLRLDGYLIVQFKEHVIRIKKVRDKLETCVDPLDVSQGQHIINIVTGKISNKNVNVEDAVRIEEAQLQEFESACPTGFYQTIKMKVITMTEGKKQRGADPMEQCDSGLIFERVTALMSTRAINLNDVMKNELAAVLTSVFDEKCGELRISKSKSILKRRLQVEVTNPSRGTGLRGRVVKGVGHLDHV